VRRAVAIIAFAVLAACSSENFDGVVMEGESFSPEEFTVKVGDALEWKSSGGGAHTVTAYGDSLPDGAEFFASGGARSEQDARDDLSGGLLTEGETYSVTFSEPGTYEYFCIPHEQVGMTGTIIVEE
jgi:plastocyanin